MQITSVTTQGLFGDFSMEVFFNGARKIARFPGNQKSVSTILDTHPGERSCGPDQVGEITWPSHVTGVPTPPFSSNEALNSYAIFQGVGKSHFKKN